MPSIRQSIPVGELPRTTISFRLSFGADTPQSWLQAGQCRCAHRRTGLFLPRLPAVPKYSELIQRLLSFIFWVYNYFVQFIEVFGKAYIGLHLFSGRYVQVR
jgi:hypothetical protein